MIHAVLFDLDGTIVDNDAAHYYAWRKILERYGKHLSRSDYDRHYKGRNTTKILQDVLNLRFNQNEINTFKAKKAVYYRNELKNAKVRDGFRELIDYVKINGLKTALVTSASPGSRHETLSRFNLAHHFDIMIGIEHVTYSKPAPDMYIKAAESLVTKPENCLVIEDSGDGLEAGKRSGAITASMKNPDNESDYCVESFFDVIGILKDHERNYAKI